MENRKLNTRITVEIPEYEELAPALRNCNALVHNPFVWDLDENENRDVAEDVAEDVAA